MPAAFFNSACTPITADANSETNTVAAKEPNYSADASPRVATYPATDAAAVSIQSDLAAQSINSVAFNDTIVVSADNIVTVVNTVSFSDALRRAASFRDNAADESNESNDCTAHA